MGKTLRILLITLLLTSCKEIKPSFLVLLGNYYYDQGSYQEAIALYFDSLNYKVQEEVILFNLGVAYNALGEAEPAITMWDRSSKGISDHFRSISYYNKGVVLYQLNKFEEASHFFKKSLIINPNNLNTKINLELAIGKFKEQENRESSLNDEQTVTNNKALNSQQERILDYLRRREVFFWNNAKEGSAWQQHQDDW